MPYAAIMVYVDPEGRPGRIVRLAAQLADRFAAKLTGMSAQAISPPVIAGGVVIDAATQASEIQRLRTSLADKEQWFRSAVGSGHQDLEWRYALEPPAEALVREARSADLLVIGQDRDPEVFYDSLDRGEVILKAGRPVLLVAEGVESLEAKHVLIGWKDTREARRAVQDALPILQGAACVTVSEVCRPGEEMSARERIEDVVRYLGRHRVKAVSKVVEGESGSASAHLIRQAQAEGADLFVTGAYGHSRLGEWIFGGVTRDLLSSSPICCLMSH